MRRAFVFFLAVVLMTSIFVLPAQAVSVEPRVTVAVPELAISGSTATCSLMASADNASDYLVATIKLYRGSLCIATWGATGYGYIHFSQNKGVLSGYTYTMKVDLTVNGVKFPVGDVSRAC